MASEDTRHIHGIYTYLQIKLIYIKINESKKNFSKVRKHIHMDYNYVKINMDEEGNKNKS